MLKTLIKNASIVNEGSIYQSDILIEDEVITKIEANGISDAMAEIIDLNGDWLIPGVIDDQVHFREPGLTHKAEIRTESRAALKGGVTSYMEMPNTIPQAVTIELLEQKYNRAALVSAVNYSFFLGGTNSNWEETKRVNAQNICGLKLFMGSSTGDMLVDHIEALENHFRYSPVLIATHCEDETSILRNLEKAKEKYGSNIPPSWHPIIRDEQACILSSTLAIKLAQEFGTRLHILHITTAEEAAFFDATTPLHLKRITSEVCVHHLHFSADDYEIWGNQIKCNPAIKASKHKDALWEALLDNRLDIIATDHAPHTREEKSQPYLNVPSGLPLVQHPLLLMLHYKDLGKISVEKIVEKMCHAPSLCFNVEKRGFIREGYFADLVSISKKSTTVSKDSLEYKCGWSPLEGMQFNYAINHVWINGTHSLKNEIITEKFNPKRLTFKRS